MSRAAMANNMLAFPHLRETNTDLQAQFLRVDLLRRRLRKDVFSSPLVWREAIALAEMALLHGDKIVKPLRRPDAVKRLLSLMPGHIATLRLLLRRRRRNSARLRRGALLVEELGIQTHRVDIFMARLISLADESRNASDQRSRAIAKEAGESIPSLRARATRLQRRHDEYQMAQRDFAEGNIRLVIHWAGIFKQRKAFRNIELEELIAEANLGLLRAVELYDPRQACKFSTYATQWIRQKLLRLEETQNRRVATLSLDTFFSTDTDFRGTDLLEGRSPTNLDSMASIERTETIYDRLQSLDPRAHDIITARFGLGRKTETLEGIGKRLGLSRERVRQIERRTLKHLKGVLQGVI